MSENLSFNLLFLERGCLLFIEFFCIKSTLDYFIDITYIDYDVVAEATILNTTLKSLDDHNHAF